MNKLNVVFMGTPDFGIPTLKYLLNEHNLQAVFCQPDKINGRNNAVTFCPIKQFAVDNKIPVFQPVSLNNEETFRKETMNQFIKDIK